MKIRIISDLHLDINKGLPFQLKDKEIFTIICGDISGYVNMTTEWLSQNVKRGIFVAGNHILYNESEHSLQYLLRQYEQKYPLDAQLSFLNDNYKVVDNIVFVGGTLWTDYCLFNNDQKDLYMWYAIRGLNDFHYGKYNSDADVENENIKRLRKLRPEDCAEMFNRTITAIDEVCRRFPEKEIVVVTHHAPSLKSIAPQYKDDPLTACFASNLEEFILDRPNIKLWCHGHIHTACDYTIGECRVICNPRGYAIYNESLNFNPKLII